MSDSSETAIYATETTSNGVTADTAQSAEVETGAINEVHVSTRDALKTALRNATPGTHILVAPGTYSGYISAFDVHGTAEAPIVVRAADPSNRPVFHGRAEGFHLINVSYLELHDLIIEGSNENGLNISDGGVFDRPAHHIVLDNLLVRDIGAGGNEDGIKLSGVDYFEIRNSRILRWGAEGSGIDMVGAHHGVIENNYLRNRDSRGNNGIMAKGSSLDIVIRNNRLEHAGDNAVQIGGGGSTLHSRPDNKQGYSAKDVVVERNVIIGSESAVAFVNNDTSIVRYNTIYNPTKWLFRLLKPIRLEGFENTPQNGTVERNIVVWSNSLRSHINIGDDVVPETFQFVENWWYNASNPANSTPTLPVQELGGVYGIDPQFVNPTRGRLHLESDSPATDYGAYAP